MPHQCVHCGKIYSTTDSAVLKGCSCGSHFFFFFKEQDIKEVKEETEKLTRPEREEIEKDVKEIIGPEMDQSRPVILNFETIRVKKPGKFEIDLVSLFKRKPLVYKLDEGKYIIDIISTFQLRHGRRDESEEEKEFRDREKEGIVKEDEEETHPA